MSSLETKFTGIAKDSSDNKNNNNVKEPANKVDAEKTDVVKEPASPPIPTQPTQPPRPTQPQQPILQTQAQPPPLQTQPPPLQIQAQQPTPLVMTKPMEPKMNNNLEGRVNSFLNRRIIYPTLIVLPIVTMALVIFTLDIVPLAKIILLMLIMVVITAYYCEKNDINLYSLIKKKGDVNI